MYWSAKVWQILFGCGACIRSCFAPSSAWREVRLEILKTSIYLESSPA